MDLSNEGQTYVAINETRGSVGLQVGGEGKQWNEKISKQLCFLASCMEDKACMNVILELYN